MKNLIAEIVVFVPLFLLALLIRIAVKKKKIQQNFPFAAIAIVLLAVEMSKQIWSLSTGYNLYYIPLQICSLFLICYPLAAFAKGRLRSAAMFMSLCLGCSVTLAQLFLSQILTRDYMFKLFTPEATPFYYFTVVYHHLVVLHFMLMLLLMPYKLDKRDVLPTVASYAVFMGIACAGANLLHTNFSGFINYGARAFDYFKRYGQAVFNLVGFTLNTLEYLLGIGICFGVRAIAKAKIKGEMQ